MDYRLLLVTLMIAVCCCCGLPNITRPYNILVFLPTETKSHFIGFKPLLETLVTRGHNVTLVSPFGLGSGGTPLPKYTHVKVEITENVAAMDFLDRNSLINRLPLYMVQLWLGPMITKNAVDKKSVRDFVLGDQSTFDVVVVENFFHECFVTLGHKYGVPVVQLLPFASNPRVSQWHGNPYGLAYMADFVAGYVAPMTFPQRVQNAVAALFNTWVNRLLYMPQQRAIMDEHFAYAGHEDRPDLDMMLRNVSLTLVNSHPLIGPAAPYVPSYIQVAGMHMKPAGPLPMDLKIILDSAKHGVIYFSLGSVVKSSKMPREIVSFLLSELAKLKQMVLWKWEDDQLPDLPKNVMVKKWFPQNDILGHPNCRLFITHGGILSLIEAIYHGVPMLSIPVFGDQTHNSIEAESRGFALYVSYFELTAEIFGSKLRQILRDPRYGEAVAKASSIMRDNPTSTIDKAVFWIEFVVRHGGAPHLRTVANQLYWFQYYMLDVIAATMAALAVVSYLNFKCLSYLLKKISGGSKRSASKVSKLNKKKQ
ncbi:PREDICTED: UDP-glucuronosyltransferase 2C1-like isoform X2 [Diuraphis noxia]|uniref:UDP-glucuronosyltransferase 2C1-like isoform X2 n=1 Tax=Diuraphis noxia TaxID=143948 RepID=UPI0007637B51|nr:PREDICTED: UDP-glucuronosyltransferase 2C1-like isoform X2 [Diuraphis noxia]